MTYMRIEMLKYETQKYTLPLINKIINWDDENPKVIWGETNIDNIGNIQLSIDCEIGDICKVCQYDTMSKIIVDKYYLACESDGGLEKNQLQPKEITESEASDLWNNYIIKNIPTIEILEKAKIEDLIQVIESKGLIVTEKNS